MKNILIIIFTLTIYTNVFAVTILNSGEGLYLASEGEQIICTNGNNNNPQLISESYICEVTYTQYNSFHNKCAFPSFTHGERRVRTFSSSNPQLLKIKINDWRGSHKCLSHVSACSHEAIFLGDTGPTIVDLGSNFLNNLK